MPLHDAADFGAIRFDPPDLEARYRMGAADDAGAQEKLKQVKAKHAVFGKTGGPYLRSSFVRGETQFLMDLAGDQPLAKPIAEKVLWERQQEEWKFKESGLDQKEYSGKTYPTRETQYTIELNNGEKITGGVVAPLYIDTPDGQKIYILHKRDKGEVGQTLGDLVYVQSVEFGE